mmetsp:Transcript_27433/g.58694  ORF Transcript_27433/g.58694 Transcript_27433/m.58694 type:complete len:94 (+) Transcript_27433:1001-1282(+)
MAFEDHDVTIHSPKTIPKGTVKARGFSSLGEHLRHMLLRKKTLSAMCIGCNTPTASGTDVNKGKKDIQTREQPNPRIPSTMDPANTASVAATR